MTELTDLASAAVAGSLERLSNERMQQTKGSSRVAFAADPRCSPDCK